MQPYYVGSGLTHATVDEVVQRKAVQVHWPHHIQELARKVFERGGALTHLQVQCQHLEIIKNAKFYLNVLARESGVCEGRGEGARDRDGRRREELFERTLVPTWYLLYTFDDITVEERHSEAIDESLTLDIDDTP